MRASTRAMAFLALALLASAPASTWAQCTKHWVNPDGGSWFEPFNWTPPGAPNPSDDVCIDLQSVSYTVELRGSAVPVTVASLRLDAGNGQATLALGAGITLDVTGMLLNGQGDRVLGLDLFPDELTATLDALVENYGLIEAVNVPLAISSLVGGAHVNHGEVASSGAGLTFDLNDHGGAKVVSSFTNQGNIRIGITKAPTTVTIEGGTFDPSTGTVSGNGTLLLESTTVGSIVAGATLNVGTYELVLANTTVAPTVAIVNSHNTLVWGTSAVQSIFTNTQPATLRLEGTNTHGNAVLTFTGSFANDGRVEFDNSNTSGPQDASLVVAPPGVFTNQPTGVVAAYQGNGGGRTIAAELQNLGSVRAVNSNLLLSGGDHNHVNLGELWADGSTITVDLSSVTKVVSSFTNQGNIRIGITKQGSHVQIEHGTFNPDSGTITGNGDLELISTLISNPFGGPCTLVNDTTLLRMADTTIADGCSVVNNGSTEVLGQNLVDGSLSNTATGALRGVGTIDARTGSFVNSGRLGPGTSPGHLSVLGNLAQASTATVEVEIGGRLQGADFDWLEVSGNMQLAGTLELQLIPFDLVSGDAFTILTYGSRTGTFASIVRPVLDHELSWEFDAFAGQGVVSTICLGRDLSIALTADKDPVSVGHELHYTATVSNHSPLPAAAVNLRDPLPSTVIFLSGSSSAGCFQLGGDVICTIGGVAGGGTAAKVIAVEPISPGDVTNTVTVELDECDLDPGNNSASVTVRATLALPCDADSDWVVDADDLPVAVGHIFGIPAPGNPDCAEGGGVNAADLAALIVELMQ